LDRADVVDHVREMLITISRDMREKAVAASTNALQDLESLENIPEKVVRFGWCGTEECGHTFEERTGLKLLGTPYQKEDYQGKCLVCGKPVDRPTYASRSM